MQSQNNFIEKSKITMNLSVVADTVIEDPVIEDPDDTVETNFDSKIQRSNFIEPHSDSEDEIKDKHVYKIPLKHFGTFELELKKVQISGEIKTINVMIDNSGSMDRRCSDGNTQLEQVIFVTERVLRFIEENCPDGNISVSVKTFSTRVRTIF